MYALVYKDPTQPLYRFYTKQKSAVCSLQSANTFLRGRRSVDLTLVRGDPKQTSVGNLDT